MEIVMIDYIAVSIVSFVFGVGVGYATKECLDDIKRLSNG